MEPNHILFFYFLQLAKDNFRYMREIEKFVKIPKQNYFLDIFLIYLYMNLGMQVNIAIRYIHFYIRKTSETDFDTMLDSPRGLLHA